MRKFNICNAASPMVAIALLTFGCSDPSAPAASSTSQVAIQVVEVVIPEPATFKKTLTVVGIVEPLQFVEVLPLESGFIAEFLVDEGDAVQKGDLLVRLENPILNREKKALEVEADVANKALERLRQAMKGSAGLIPAVDLEQAQASYARASAALAVANDRLEFLNVTAPFDGFISARYLHPGAVVKNGQLSANQKPLLSIVQCKSLRIRLPFPERDAAFLNRGDSVELYFPDAERMVNTQIAGVASDINAKEHTLDALVNYNQAACDLRPGMYVEGSVYGNSQVDVLSVPTSVRFERDGLSLAFIVKDGIVQEIPLKVIAEDKTRLAIQGAGIDANTQFVSAGRSLVSVGDRTQVKRAL
jgi:RND family efflux transporter MFP subunit